MKRHCRECKVLLPATLYFKCEKCKSKAFVMEDDSIYVPASFDLDELTESIVDLFGEGILDLSKEEDLC